MNNGQKIFRWIAVLPGSIIAGIAMTFVLHFILYFTLTKFVTPYPEFPERALTPFAIAATFIWAGCEIAPNNKLKVGIILFAIWIFLAGGFIMVTLTGGKWFGKSLYLDANGVAPIMGIVGAFVGLYLVTKKDKEKQHVLTGNDNYENAVNTQQNDKAETSFYSKYGGDIFSLIFISLFVLCIYNSTSRNIIFVILLLLSLFIVIFSIKEKLFTTTTMKINLVKDIVMMISLIVGLINKETGLYVSIICLGLYSLDFIRNFVMTQIVGKNSTNAQH